LDYEAREGEFEPRETPVGDYRKLVDLPPGLDELLPSSMDIVGDIVGGRLPDELGEFVGNICGAIARAHNAKTVAVDRGVKGEMRLRDLQLVIGKETGTVHREYGLSLELDLGSVYFSPRLSSERWRISNLVRDGETIIDMFCGIGSFAIMIAKHRNPKRIYAIDINPTAIEFLRSNVFRNRVDKIVPILGDAKDIVKKLESADRIIMNLPLSSFEFFESALMASRNGGVIHYYEILERDDVSERARQLESVAAKHGKELILKPQEVKSYSSTRAHFAFDLEIRG
jgi:tRNA (guanine37-N1)-methyltransferase